MANRQFNPVAILAAAVLGFGALAFSPEPAQAVSGCVIVCETCSVNMTTGQAECKNCTLTNCTVQQT